MKPQYQARTQLTKKYGQGSYQMCGQCITILLSDGRCAADEKHNYRVHGSLPVTHLRRKHDVRRL